MSKAEASEGSHLTPSLESARVSDAMRHGILSCPADASLRDAARTMSLHHVHMIVVSDPANGSLLGTLTYRLLLDALFEKRPLGEIADRELCMVSSGELLTVAAELMRDRGVTHLVVRDAQSRRPVGTLSTLDVACVLGWGET
jgi:CBS domain-containing protein